MAIKSTANISKEILIGENLGKFETYQQLVENILEFSKNVGISAPAQEARCEGKVGYLSFRTYITREGYLDVNHILNHSISSAKVLIKESMLRSSDMEEVKEQIAINLYNDRILHLEEFNNYMKRLFANYVPSPSPDEASSSPIHLFTYWLEDLPDDLFKRYVLFNMSKYTPNRVYGLSDMISRYQNIMTDYDYGHMMDLVKNKVLHPENVLMLINNRYQERFKSDTMEIVLKPELRCKKEYFEGSDKYSI